MKTVLKKFATVSKSIHACLGVACLFQLAEARQVNHREENEWTSTQKSGTGNIGLLSENFVDQFFADPSMQARKKEAFDFQLTSLNFYYNTDDFNEARKDTESLVKKLQTDGEASGVAAGLQVLDFVSSLTGKRIELGGSLQLLSFRVARVSVVPHINVFTKGNIDVPTWPEVGVTLDQYSAVGLGYSHPLGKNFDLGINLRPGVRVLFQQELSASSIEVASGSESETEGEGGAGSQFIPTIGVYVPVDLGLGMNIGKDKRANFVLRNAFGGAVTELSESSNKSPDYPLHASLGGSWDFYSSKNHKMRMASDLQDILGMVSFDDVLLRWQWGFQYLYKLSFRSKTSFGLNAGLQSGYPSIGVLLDLFLAKFEMAYFTFEGGASPGQNPVPAYSFRLFSEMSF